MYNIEELNSMGQEQLKEIAKSMGLKKINDIETDELIYKILDQQAIDKAMIEADGTPNKRQLPRNARPQRPQKRKSRQKPMMLKLL